MYLLAGAIMRLYIKAALNYTVHTGYIRCASLLVQSCVYTSKPQFLTQCIQATYAVPPCWCNYAFTHQSRTYLHSAYRLHTLYLLAGAIMRFTHQSRTYLHSAYRLHTLYLLAGAIMRLHIKAALPYTGYIRCTSLLVQLCVYTSKSHLLAQCIQATYAVPPCWCNYAFYTSKSHLLAQCIQATYAVPPCWCNYAFTYQSRTSLYRLHTLYLPAGAIIRLHMKVCTYSHSA